MATPPVNAAIRPSTGSLSHDRLVPGWKCNSVEASARQVKPTAISNLAQNRFKATIKLRRRVNSI